LTFVATGRLMVWDMRCKKCNANFGVLVHNSTGATVDIPANAIGESQSTVPAAYAKGTYHVTVIADAPWTVSLIDPTALATLAAPFNYFTYGTGVLGPFSGNDSSLLMGYIGTLGSAATVTVYDESLKSAPQKLIYSSASFYKSLTIPSPPARYYLVITTTGLWNLKVDG